MFRTVSEIRARIGRCFIAENASAPVPEAFARWERRGEAVPASRKNFQFSDFLGHHADLLKKRVYLDIWCPFFPVASRGNPADTRGRTTSLRSVVPAPVRSSRGQASRRPSPPRVPLPRRRMRRGCAEPAPPAGPSGAAGSRQPLGTLRSPPRPRGGANRAGERVTPLFLLEPPGPVAQRT